MSREQIIRDTAYAIWEAEGRPSGRDRDHWAKAEQQVAMSMDASRQQGEEAAPIAKPAARKKAVRKQAI
ncbi:DUF2934 domain-containing protein [Terrarubrum flagellatum]|uniref:DUF2934 domain-containing protein n=1 Tax=Terrirubrum flagellatum TaxID=2895980 RepID=UPI0031453AB8